MKTRPQLWTAAGVIALLSVLSIAADEAARSRASGRFRWKAVRERSPRR